MLFLANKLQKHYLNFLVSVWVKLCRICGVIFDLKLVFIHVHCCEEKDQLSCVKRHDLLNNSQFVLGVEILDDHLHCRDEIDVQVLAIEH